MADNELFGISEQLNDLISRRAALDEKNVVHMELFGSDYPVVPVATLKGLPPVDAVPVEDVFELAIALNKEIEALELSVRAYNALSRCGCRTVGDVYRLLKSGKIKKVRNLGDKSIGEIEDRLNAYLRRAEGEYGKRKPLGFLRKERGCV